VSRRWRQLATTASPWVALRNMEAEGGINWEHFRMVEDDPGWTCWAASSTSREEGKADKWHTCQLPCGNSTVMLVRKCNEEGVSYDIVRWVGCLQGMNHPNIAALQVVSAEYCPETGTRVHCGFQHADTSLQKLVYRTLERTSHTVTGRALPDLMLRSIMYQLLSALAYSHARGVPHGNLAPYRVLAHTLDASADHYLVLLADFGFSPPAAALCNEELPIRPSRASPELGPDHKRKRYGPANDLWALGTVFAEVACGNRDPQVYMMIQELESTDEPTMSANLPMLPPHAHDLMRQLMRQEPMDRITAAQALCHPYFEGIHEQCPVVGKYLPRSKPFVSSFLELRAHEAWSPGVDFLQQQPELNPRMWSILLDWLSVVSHKFKFVPRSFQLAVDFMRRYMATAEVSRKRLQLVGIGALCLACKHEEVMIPNMNDFIFICDNAYTLHELMDIEVEILNTLNMQLHVPTVHDHMLATFVEMGVVPDYPDGLDPPKSVKWCESLALMGLTQHSVALHDMAVLARCVATLGGLLAKGVASEVVCPDGSRAEGCPGGKLSERVCFLQSADDWNCLEELIKAVETTTKEHREILVKCNPDFAALKPLPHLLDEFAKKGRTTRGLKGKEVKAIMERHYSIQRTREMNLYNEFPAEDSFPTSKKPVFFRGTTSTTNAHVFSIAAVTCGLGRQLLAEQEGHA